MWRETSQRSAVSEPPHCAFKYAPLLLPAKCATSMWMLTLSGIEWGGQFKPEKVDGVCQLACDGVDLIRGTGLEDHPDARLYAGDSNRKVRIASTPFYHEVSRVFPLCDSGVSVNMFFHTHPLLMLRNAKTQLARCGPPSIGDHVAHNILANYRNWKENKQVNTTVVMAFEGMYMYTVLPHKFMRVVVRIAALVKACQMTASEQKLADKGQPPMSVMKQIKAEVFDELRDGGLEYQDAMTAFVKAHPGMFCARGAPTVHNSLWSKKGHAPELDFEFARSLGDPRLVEFCRNNPMVTACHQHGYHVEFYPAPFAEDVVLLAPTSFVDGAGEIL